MNHHYRKIVHVFAIFLLTSLSFINLSFAKTNAKISTKQTSIDEYIILTITTDQKQPLDPDLSSLQDNFKVISQRANQSYTNFNGVISQENIWIIELLPLKIGDILIPKIKVGGEFTNDITINVAKSLLQQNNDIEVLLESNKESVYVQESIPITITIRFKTKLVSGNLTNPTSYQIDFKQYGRDINTKENINGEVYSIFKRHFIGYSNSSGQINIDPVSLQAIISQNNSNNTGSYRKKVNILSNPLSINVKPQPTNIPHNSPWIPAKDLSLSESWDIPSKPEVGSAITHQVSISILGLHKDQIPQIKFDEINGANIYQDQIEQETNIINHDFSSIYKITNIIIPDRAGELKIPALNITWFNTQTGQLEVSKTKEKIISIQENSISSVLPSNQIPIKKDPTLEKNEETKEVKEKNNPVVIKKTNRSNILWILISFVLFTLWLITSYYLYITLKKNKKVIPSTNKPKTTPSLGNLSNKSLSQQQAKLLKWWNQQGFPHVNNLCQIADLISDKRTKSALFSLESNIYKKDKDFEQVDWQLLIKQKKLHPKQTNKGGHIPPLHQIGESI